MDLLGSYEAIWFKMDQFGSRLIKFGSYHMYPFGSR